MNMLSSIVNRAESIGFLAIGFSRDGRRMATSHADGTVRLWDLPNGGEVANLAGHYGLDLALAFSPDSQLLASGSYDGTLRLWGLRP